MILYLEPALKVLITLSVFIISYFIYRKRASRFQCVLICTLLLCCAVFAHAVSNCVPLLTDQVTLTALGEKRVEASAEEVYLNGFTVDGMPVSVGNPVQGKWSWIGDNYAWRIETDPRQPKGVTREVTVELPVGIDRTIHFESNIWRGMVEVKLDGETQNIDTYYGDGTIISGYPLCSSTFTKLLCSELLPTLVYTVVFLVGGGLCYWCFCSTSPLKKKINRIIVENYDICIYIFLGIFMLVAMRFYHQFNDMFWGDELATISFTSQDSLLETINCNLVSWDFTPPLFNIILWFLLKIIPQSLNTLYYIPQIFLALNVFVMGMIGRRLFNKPLGVIAAVVVATSASLVLCTGYEIRSYSLYLLGVSCALLLYIEHLKRKEFSIKYAILMAIIFTVVLYSHYFGAMIVGILFLADLWLIIKKKLSRKYLIPYFISSGAILLWLYLVFKNMNSSYTSGVAPTIIDVLNTISFFFSGAKLYIFIWLATVVWLFLHIKVFQENYLIKLEYYIVAISLIGVFSNVTVVFVFSQVKAIYKNRYFVGLIPFAIIILLFGINKLADYLSQRKVIISPRIKAVGLIVLFICSGWYMNDVILHDMGVKDNRIIIDQNNGKMAYIDIINTLKSKTDILYQDTGVFVNQPEAYSYLLKNEHFEDVNIEHANSTENIAKYNTIYYVYYDWESVNYLEQTDIIKNCFTEAERDENLCIVKYTRNT